MSTALMVIDVQVGIMEYVAQASELLATIGGLLERARSSGIPVIYVQHGENEGLVPHTPAWEIHPQIAPKPGEPVVHKRACDSFHETNLRELLGQRGITSLIVTGCQTEFCVDSTCRRAVTLGYDVTLVKEGHGTMDSPALTAGQIVTHHNLLLNGFSTATNSIRVRSVQDLTI